MPKFQMQIAGQTAIVHALFDSTPQYCRNYLTEAAPDFSITVRGEDLRFEQAELDAEAMEEGFRRRVFTDPFLERAAIQRSFAEHLFDRDTLLTHGSCVAVDGYAYLFTARSGTGKSTHTRLWMEVFGPRAQMINDDKPFLQLSPNGVLACGAPWSGKHGLDSNLSLPLAGICILERGSKDRIRPIKPQEALPMLRKQTYLPKGNEARFHALVATLAESVPLWHMECTKDCNAALVAHAAMSPK